MSMDNKVPEIRFKGFSGEWVEHSWSNTVDVSTNMVDPRNSQYEELFHVGPGNIESFTGRFYNNVLKVKDSNLISGKFHFNNGDIIYGKINPQLAKYVIAPFEGLASADAYVLNAKNGVIQNYLFAILHTKEFYKYTVSVSSRTGMPKINRDELNTYSYMAPSESEQTAIGKFFQKLDVLINKHKKKHGKLSSIKKAMLEKMFPKQGKTIPEIRFKGFSGEWEEKMLGTDIAEIIGGGTPSTSISEFWDGDIDWYSPTEIGENVYAKGSQKKITPLGLKSCSAKILPAGNTVLFTSRAGIGDMAILTKPGSTNQGFQSIIVKEGYSPYFIFSAGKQIKDFALKHASGSTFLEISGKQLGRMKILMPSLEEQTAIGNYFEKLDSLINQYQQQITKLNNIKQACLSKMFV
ncbi:restriction endonuclease subunit S [Serratia ureilytica]|uniref:restriction endonuclease subunit S n=1 Tax=Serratia ureilytica TaxID=300181 RepID=UPI00159C75D1|nr:restriction endonuclease subunit S [Serratia ureilytica]NVM51632.1 restriction endonuclease subunit S [Serratia ureilytica]